MSVYITGGSLHRRSVSIPDLQGLRPTSAKVRQALFNMLGDIENNTVLDLFSGSGLMSLEAISRGAIVTSIESERMACQAQEKNKSKWQLQQWSIRQGQVEQQLKKLRGQSFDLIFADPPYDSGWCQKLPQLLSDHNIHTPTLIIEELAKVKPCWPQPWYCTKSKCYGQTQLHFLETSPRG